MTARLGALLAHARSVPADERARLAAVVAARRPAGHVVLETCHRVEVYGAPLADDLLRLAPAGSTSLSGDDVVGHVMRLAVGRESIVVAEDQVLHQLRTCVGQARDRGPLSPELDRLFDIALRAGRRARSWLPARRGSLVDVALARVTTGHHAPRRMLVVGAGEMGHAAAHAATARGCEVIVASRTPERAQALAEVVGGRALAWDPGPAAMGDVDGVVVALRGRWAICDATRQALASGAAWVVDLSAPPALPAELVAALGDRLLLVDDLAAHAGPPLSARIVDRLDRLADKNAAEYRAWSDAAARRAAARALAERAAEARSAELSALWERVRSLEPAQRREVERMAHHLTERLLRDPLEQLGRDADGRVTRAARELFRL